MCLAGDGRRGFRHPLQLEQRLRFPSEAQFAGGWRLDGALVIRLKHVNDHFCTLHVSSWCRYMIDAEFSSGESRILRPLSSIKWTLGHAPYSNLGRIRGYGTNPCAKAFQVDSCHSPGLSALLKASAFLVSPSILRRCFGPRASTNLLNKSVRDPSPPTLPQQPSRG
jgi:hypothetical protein